MADEDHVAMLKQGIPAWNAWRIANKDIRPDLSKADLKEIVFFTDVSVAADRKMNLRDVNLRQADLSGANLRESILNDADLREAKLHGTKFENADLRGANFTKANLFGADLRTAKMENSILKFSDLRSASFSSRTTLKRAVVRGARINRYDLECLDNYGGLTLGDRMEMEIQDGVALLRASYSGFLQWFHLIALATFLFPYAWFVAVQWSTARFLAAPDDAWIPLWKALSRFIYNGGIDWHLGYEHHWTFDLFLFMLAYNILRGVLLWKTKSLETQQDSTGLPANFSLWRSPWRIPYAIARAFFPMNLAVVVMNTGHFFTQNIPIPSG